MTAASELKQRLAGVRGLLLDVDGVLVLRGKLIPGAAESLAALDAARFPYRLATNYSLFSRVSLSGQFAKTSSCLQGFGKKPSSSSILPGNGLVPSRSRDVAGIQKTTSSCWAMSLPRPVQNQN